MILIYSTILSPSRHISSSGESNLLEPLKPWQSARQRPPSHTDFTAKMQLDRLNTHGIRSHLESAEVVKAVSSLHTIATYTRPQCPTAHLEPVICSASIKNQYKVPIRRSQQGNNGEDENV